MINAHYQSQGLIDVIDHRAQSQRSVSVNVYIDQSYGLITDIDHKDQSLAFMTDIDL